ncbi:MAG: hypothetical protein IPK52_13365 [Chloroflexi bacterium]|nr:hypothetical protein [Chloroflexota bacterium]
MNRKSPFADEWRSCLREHYKQTVREKDRATLETLTGIMNSVGFREDDLRTLMIEATMRAEDMPDGYLPPLDLLEQPLPNRHPAECQCPQCVAVDVVPHDMEGQPLEGDALKEQLQREAWEQGVKEMPLILDEPPVAPDAEEEDPDGYKQLSMFD